MTLGSCWGRFGHMEAPLGHLGPLWGHFGITLRILWGGIWGSLWAYEGGFGTLWGDSELTLGPVLAYGDDFGMVIVSSWVYKMQFFKNNKFPNAF